MDSRKCAMDKNYHAAPFSESCLAEHFLPYMPFHQLTRQKKIFIQICNLRHSALVFVDLIMQKVKESSQKFDENSSQKSVPFHQAILIITVK